MMRTNAVAAAIEFFGGLTGAVTATGISAATWCRYRRLGRIADPARVFQVADLTGLDARRLAGVPVTDDEHEPPPVAVGPAGKATKGKLRPLPDRPSSGVAARDEPRAYGTIRKRNNWPLLMAA